MRLMDSIEKLANDLRANEVVTVFCDTPQLKLEFAIELVKYCVNNGLPVSYLDFDLLFSSFVQNITQQEYAKIATKGMLKMIQPEEHAIEESLVSLASDFTSRGGFIILDSANMIQNLLSLSSTPANQTAANHKSAILISLIQQIGRKWSKTILVLALTRARPKRFLEASSWEKEMVGGRMIKFKSDWILFLKQAANPHPEHGSRLTMELKESPAGGRDTGEKYYTISAF